MVLAVALAVVVALPGVSGALTSGEEFAQDSFTVGEIAAEIGASSLYEQGFTGAGVTVAVIDTGVADVPGLSGDKVIHGPDLSFESGVEGLYNVDTYGHGTVMASIIAGNDGEADGFRGIAPGARILSVKVADNTGAVDVTQVIAAIDFVIETRDDSGVRVINLSYEADGAKKTDKDPLIAAVERAWDAGIVVVVSAGNGGNKTKRLGSPATSPFVIAVGASDEDHQSSRYVSTGSKKRLVDITAPGSRVLGLASPGSRLVQENPDAFIGERFLRGSGTSQAAAVVSGSAALLLEQRPELTPDQVKALLMGSASEEAKKKKGKKDKGKKDKKGDGPVVSEGSTPVKAGTAILNLFDPSEEIDKKHAKKLPKDEGALIELLSDEWSGTKFGQQKLQRTTGAGHLDVGRAAGFLTVDVEQRHDRSDGTGKLDDARGNSVVTLPNGSQLVGEVTFTGSSWSGSTWTGSSWTGSSWSGSSWSGSSWSGSSWSGSSWSGSSWSGSSWSGSSWSGSSWSGSSWSGSSWSGSSWSGSSWSGAAWAGVSWE